MKRIRPVLHSSQDGSERPSDDSREAMLRNLGLESQPKVENNSGVLRLMDPVSVKQPSQPLQAEQSDPFADSFQPEEQQSVHEDPVQQPAHEQENTSNQFNNALEEPSVFSRRRHEEQSDYESPEAALRTNLEPSQPEQAVYAEAEDNLADLIQSEVALSRAAPVEPEQSEDALDMWRILSDDEEPKQEAPAESNIQREVRQPAPAPEDVSDVLSASVFDLATDSDEDAPSPPPTRRRAGRVKTRLLGIDNTISTSEDVFAKTEQTPVTKKPPAVSQEMFPVGWLIVRKGPGRGNWMPLFPGVSQIGRGEGQQVQLGYGDTSISRENHAAIAFDDEQRQFYLGHGGKSNLVRLNGAPVLSTEPLGDRDQIRIGETTLQLITVCDENFSWSDGE